MPASPVQGTLQNVGDIVGPIALGNTGVGNPLDQSAIASFTGTFVNATISIEAIPLAQPVNPPTLSAGPFAAGAPVSPSEWIPIQEVGVLDGIPVSSPVGPLSSAGGAGTGFGFIFPANIFQQIRLRLVSIGSGAIQAGIASLPFPAPPNLSGAQSSLLLELQRIRIGISDLVQTDLKEVVPTLTATGA